MGPSGTEHIEAQIRALVEIFIEGVTGREAAEILDRGPCALVGASFRWAWEAAKQIEGLDPVDPVQSASLEAHAPVVMRLRDLACDAFVARFGVPRPPRLPARPEGLEADVVINLDGDDHRRMTRTARLLCDTAIYSVRMSWQCAYYIARNRDRSQYVLWVQWEDGESYRYFTTHGAYLEAVKGLSERDAALILLEDYWSRMRDEWDRTRPNEVTGYGTTITQDELELVAERVWPPEADASRGSRHAS